MAEDDLLAAPRDASAWDRPNVQGRKKVHVAVDITESLATYWDPHPAPYANAACDPGAMPLDMSVSSPAERIPEDRRCRRPGCATRWPPFEDRDEASRG